VVGALVVIALVAFFVIRNRRRQGTKAAVANTGHQDEHKPDNPAAAPLMQQNYTLLQHEQQPPNLYQQQQVPFNPTQPHQQFNPHYQQQPFQEQPQFSQANTTNPAFVSQPVPLLVQQTSTPIFFQPHTKEPYNYTPPTFFPQKHVPAGVPGGAPAQGGFSPERITYAPPVDQNPHTSPGLPYTSLPSFTGASNVATSSPNANNPQAIISPNGFQRSDFSSPGNPQVIVQSSHNNSGYAQ